MTTTALSQLGDLPLSRRISIPLKHSQTFTPNELIAINTDGFGVPLSADPTLIVVGRLDSSPVGTGSGTFTTPSGADGQFCVEVTQGVFFLFNGTSSDLITEALIGHPCYTSDGITAEATNGGSTRPICGQVIQVDVQGSGMVAVLAGMTVNGLLTYIQAVTGIVTPISVADGGTGLAALTAHYLPIGNGTSNVTLLAPGATGQPVVSQGASSDPHYAVLGVVGGGTALATLTAHSLYVGNGTTAPTALGVAADGQLVIGATGADPTLRTLTGDVTISATGVTAIGAGKVAPPMAAVAAVGGFGVPFVITKVLADSAGGATTNVSVPQKCEVTRIQAVKNTVLSASASDLVQVKNHTSGTALCGDLLLNVAASTIVNPTTLVAAQTVIALADGIDLVQPAHVTNNGCVVIIDCIARA